MANTPAIGTAGFTTGGGIAPATSAQSAAPTDDLVWPSKTLAIGPITTGITTRGLWDVSVMGAAILFGLIGVYIILRPDFGKLINQASGLVAKGAETATVA